MVNPYSVVMCFAVACVDEAHEYVTMLKSFKDMYTLYNGLNAKHSICNFTRKIF